MFKRAGRFEVYVLSAAAVASLAGCAATQPTQHAIQPVSSPSHAQRLRAVPNGPVIAPAEVARPSVAPAPIAVPTPAAEHAPVNQPYDADSADDRHPSTWRKKLRAKYVMNIDSLD